ncbi:MAG: hypothetical protein WD844_03575 [Thermoleophilaceae bacterium]
MNEEFFSGEADERAIADALLATRMRFTADEESLSCRAGQTALVAAFVLTARLGIGTELVLPDVPLIDVVAPLRRPDLTDSLIELGGDLVPGAAVRTSTAAVDETFAFGLGRAGSQAAVHVGVTDYAVNIERGGMGSLCAGDLPFGGLAGGAAIAAIALEVALPRIENAAGLRAKSPRPSAGPPVKLNLLDLFPEVTARSTLELGAVDAISGGAITHALLFCLLRTPGLRANVRVIEEQRADLSNVNRYALLRASDEGRLKTEQLEGLATPEVKIAGVTSLFTRETRESVLPLAERVVVGVDDVEARWWVQEEQPAWLAIAATGNHLAQVTTHMPDSPCAACVHTTPLPPQTIPTISFVSFWAGLLQACALISGSREPRNVVVYPFAFGGPSPTASFAPVANRACSICCAASQALQT